MKKVLKENEAKKVMKESILLLCNAVEQTLGPEGNNCLISNSASSPFITNDGVTIAENIESNDPKIQAVLEIIKEAALKTNEKVGDGTTTTLVLTKEIFLRGLESKKNPILLKEEMIQAVNKVIKGIQKESHFPNKEELLHIASISANEEEIAKIIKEVFSKVKYGWAIHLKESPTEKTYYTIEKGYTVDIDPLPEYIFQNQKYLEINDVKILLQNELTDIESISSYINECFATQQTYCVIASFIKEEIKEQIISLQVDNSLPIYYVEIPNYLYSKTDIINDIKILLNINEENIGFTSTLILEKEKALFATKKATDKLANYIAKLKKEEIDCYDSYQREILKERIAKLENGIASIFVGGITNVEKRERKMRFEDAIHAVEIAKKGVVLGSGVTYWKVKERLKANNEGEKIIKKALEKPLKQILKNAALDTKEIVEKIQTSNFKIIYNIRTKKWEKISNTKVIDPTFVSIESLKNAISIASMLLTTKYLIINEFNEKKKNLEL